MSGFALTPCPRDSSTNSAEQTAFTGYLFRQNLSVSQFDMKIARNREERIPEIIAVIQLVFRSDEHI